MDLRQALSETAFSAGPAPAAAEARPWIAAAAVLTHFEPLTLKSEAGTLSPLSPAMAELLDASTPSRASRHARQLRPGIRRQALASLGDRLAMKAQLALNPAPDHPTQAAFQALLEGPDAIGPWLESQDPIRLAALDEAVGWVDGILDALPSPDDIAARLSRARLLAPLRRLVGEHFAGREDVLMEIAQHLNLAPEGMVLMLQGPGGVGKSTVLAKFILDAVEKSPDPPTVIVLNLDDPQLVLDDPFTLLQEAGRQLRIQHPDLNAPLDGIKGYIASLQLRSRTTEVLESVSGGTVLWAAINDVAREIVGLIPGTQPILLVLDTFEEAQTTGPSAVARLLQLVESLRAGNPRLSVIIAGRVDETSAPRRTLTLGALDPVSARAVLEKVAGLGPLPDDLADQIFDVARGNPLATHLAGKILAAEGADIFRRDADLARLIGQIRTEKVQAQLYGRVLGHIRDPEVRRLAYPGLILRRITPDVLRYVLADACGVPIPDDAEAARLFDLFASEVALAEPEAGTGALRYREDVRRVILADLRADQRELAARIDQAAIAYYRTQSGAVARAEEIYHLLASGAGEPEIDARWEPGVEPYLVRAVEELPPRAQVCLANRLRMDLRPELQKAADQHQWEQNAEQTARDLLRDDLPEQALSVLNQRTTRLPGSPLFLTEAEALAVLGQPHTALEVIAAGLASAEAVGDRLLVVNLRLLESLLHGGSQRENTEVAPHPGPSVQAGGEANAKPAMRRRGVAIAAIISMLLMTLIALAALAFVFLAGSDENAADIILGPPIDPAVPALARQENHLVWILLPAMLAAGSLWLWSRRRGRVPDRAVGPPVTVAPAEQDRQAIRHAAAEAYRIASLTHNDMARLRSIANLLRLHRNAMPPDGSDPSALVAEAEEIIDRIGLAALYEAPGLMRELAAELGMRNPQLLAMALRVTGSHVVIPPELRSEESGSAAAVTSDPRARVILGDTTLPAGTAVDVLMMIATARTADERYAMMALVTDLLAAELDARRGTLPPPEIRQRPLPWRQNTISPDDMAWFETTKAAF